MKINDTIHGFTVTSVRELPDCGGTLYEMTHEKTKASLVWLARPDENKTFAIAFRTTPEDDTGVFHILEHSVLNGSGKYPVKEPFVELLKSSMNTFLNAITYDDKTVFPVASRNTADFMNLVSVYLDAVFDPEIYRNKKIFQQEGWHYELRDPSREPVYKGVVLNEMKGAFSSVDETMIVHLCRKLFPDSCYRYVSGGDPEHITDLTYEKFIAAHRRFYHPSNARIFLDGDMDVEPVLALINDEYLSHYDAAEPDTDIVMQKEVRGEVTEYRYETNEDDLRNKTIISFGKIVSDYRDVKKNTALGILADVLTSSNDSPLKKPFLDEKLCEDVDILNYDVIKQPWVCLTFRNTEKEKLPKIKSVLRSTVSELIHGGLSHEELQAAINHAEFAYREKQEPAGIIYCEFALLSWLYGGDPAAYLNLSPVFAELRKDVDEGYFEKLLAEVFLDEEHTQTVIAVPDAHKSAERLAAEKAKIASRHLNKADVITETLALDAWQTAPDTEEKLNTLPKLSLSEINPEPTKDKYTETELNDVPTLEFPAEPSGIAYFSLYFNAAGIRKETLPALAFWISLLQELPTENHSVRSLQTAINKYIGSLSISASSISRLNETDAALPLITVRVSALQANAKEALDLVHEILTESVYDKEMIHQLLRQTLDSFRQSLISNGHVYARLRISAALSAAGVFDEYTRGCESGKFLAAFEDNFDARIDDFIEQCKLFSENLFISSRMYASYSNPANRDLMADVISSYPRGDAHRARVHYPKNIMRNEGIEIPGGVSYAVLGAPLKNDDGSMRVLSHILTYEWLWNEVRVKGGAYGTGISAGGGDNAYAYSYRDPDPANALKAFRACGRFTAAFADSHPDLDAYIIGAIAAGQPLLSPAGKISLAMTRWLAEISYENRYERRKKMLATTVEDLKRSAEQLSDAMAEGMVCIAGPKEKLDTLKEENLTILEKI